MRKKILKRKHTLLMILLFCFLFLALLWFGLQHSNRNKIQENNVVTNNSNIIVATTVSEKDQLPTANNTNENIKKETTKPLSSTQPTVHNIQPTTLINETSVRDDAVSTERVIDVPTTADYRIIVNKKRALSSDYHPQENPVAKKALLRLMKDMKVAGYSLSDHYSGYRSYSQQKVLYDNYVRQHGQKEADTFSARPGHSEHQTGLVFDLFDATGQFLGTGVQDGGAQWLAQNAHRYGFVVRYQKGKEAITGYIPEPWHLRFVGNDATAIYQRQQTLEEFYQVEGGNYR